MSSPDPMPVVRCAYYAFVFSIPFETLDIGIDSGVFSLSKMIGYAFITTALLQPALCFKKPPPAFWYFLVYVVVYICLGAFQPAEFTELVTIRLFTLAQMIVLFWISYNLLQDRRMVRGTFMAFGGSCLALSLVLLNGVSVMAIHQGRVTTLSQDANTLGAVLSLGLLALLGLAYGRQELDRKASLLGWISLTTMVTGIVITGSRGSMLSCMMGILFLVAKRGQSFLKMKVGVIAVLAIGFLIWASYQNDAIWLRWKRAYLEGNLSGREAIVPEAWNMFTEKPFIGWGPVSNYVELGARFNEPTVDTHNLYLWILTETGLLGATPFFGGLLLCWQAAWRARNGTEGSFPLALLVCVFAVNMSITWLCRKMFWLILAYALASDKHLSPLPRVRAFLNIERPFALEGPVNATISTVRCERNRMS